MSALRRWVFGVGSLVCALAVSAGALNAAQPIKTQYMPPQGYPMPGEPVLEPVVPPVGRVPRPDKYEGVIASPDGIVRPLPDPAHVHPEALEPPPPGSPIGAHYEAPTRLYSFWSRVHPFRIFPFDRCRPAPWRPKGFGNLFVDPPFEPFRQDYTPFALKSPDTQYGPSYYLREGTQYVPHCCHNGVLGECHMVYDPYGMSRYQYGNIRLSKCLCNHDDDEECQKCQQVRHCKECGKSHPLAE